MLVAYAGFKTDLNTFSASVANCLGWRKRYEAALKKSDKLLQLVNQGAIESTVKTKEDCKKRFKLTLNQWKVMTNRQIKTIEKDLGEFEFNCFLDKVNDARENPLDLSNL